MDWSMILQNALLIGVGVVAGQIGVLLQFSVKHKSKNRGKMAETYAEYLALLGRQPACSKDELGRVGMLIDVLERKKNVRKKLEVLCDAYWRRRKLKSLTDQSQPGDYAEQAIEAEKNYNDAFDDVLNLVRRTYAPKV